MKIALVSYNTFLEGETNGWKQNNVNSVFLLQNTENEIWGAPQEAIPAEKTKDNIAKVQTQIDSHWQQLIKILLELDYVVFYVGSFGAERAIELAQLNKLAPEKAIFVLCSCQADKKMDMIRKFGYATSKTISCKCGGHETMNKIFKQVLEYGNLDL